MAGLKPFIVLFAVITIVYGDVYRFLPSKSTDPAHPDHCYDEGVKAYYKPRAEYYNRPGACQKIYCFGDFSMEAQGCGLVSIPNCEELPRDLTKGFPECCPKFKCGDKIITPNYS